MILSVENLHIQYGAIKAVTGISFEVEQGSIVALLGANGAGKTTTLRAISGLLRPTEGRITFDGRNLTGARPHTIVAAGIAHAPEGRMIFANLTVMENLRMGAFRRNDAAGIAEDLEFVYALFPRLAERLTQSGGTLSGGEQQMLAIGRALMARPRLLLLDEPSLGIAPILVKSIFERIVEINRTRGITIVLVEQNAHLALAIAHSAYVLETGRIVLHGPANDVAANDTVRKAYLGE